MMQKVAVMREFDGLVGWLFWALRPFEALEVLPSTIAPPDHPGISSRLGFAMRRL